MRQQLKWIVVTLAMAAWPGTVWAGTIPELDVNVTTGDAQLVLNGLSITGYEIDSSGQLVPGNWSSVHAQGLVPAGTWSTLGVPSSDLLAEASGLATTVLASSTPIDLGHIFTVGGAHDLQFSGGDANFDTFTGNVVYVGVPEPNSLVLLVIGAAGMALAVRLRRKGLRNGSLRCDA